MSDYAIGRLAILGGVVTVAVFDWLVWDQLRPFEKVSAWIGLGVLVAYLVAYTAWPRLRR